MNTPVKFKRLNELATELSSKLDQLQLGKLSKQDLELLSDHARELYERLVVLRYNAYQTEVKGENAPVLPVEPIPTEVKEEPIAFKVIPNQISLIEAIEEVSKAEATPEEETPTVESPAPKSEVSAQQTNSLFDAPSAPVSSESLYERLSKTVGHQESLAQKMEASPIADLKKAISLNQRFQFSKELFKGNNQDYEVAIDKLNTSGREEAMSHIQQLRSKYAWNDESAITQDFLELVHRRFQ